MQLGRGARPRHVLGFSGTKTREAVQAGQQRVLLERAPLRLGPCSQLHIFLARLETKGDHPRMSRLENGGSEMVQMHASPPACPHVSLHCKALPQTKTPAALQSSVASLDPLGLLSPSHLLWVPLHDAVHVQPLI